MAENIIIGILSSVFLLLLNEIIQLYSDRKIYGYLEGEYIRTIITDSIENSRIAPGKVREDELTEEEKKKFADRGLIPMPGSRYVEVHYYREMGKNWRIRLRYLHHGMYEGVADYHKWWANNSELTKVKFTLTLNQSNLTTGSGNYKYVEDDDYGIYSFQINEDDKSEILVTYENTIPSGLAKGYEKWKRTGS
jgi:hypothetical protein